MRIAEGLNEPVRIQGIRPELLLGLIICDAIFMEYGHEVEITSVIDGKHSRGSLHYAGAAADIRSRDIPENQREPIKIKCKAALGPDFDLVLEGSHYHLEFDPKNRY
jgi:hypothetical protein|tara:strand:+ start:1251 stop:1571 length:321 start_codon:yes stop_codon:yes gene_type:complete